MNTIKPIRPSRALRVLFVLIALSAGVIQAQKREWTLEECVTYAVENNLDVQQFQLAFERTMLDKSDAIGNLLPAVNAQTQVGRNVGFTIDPSTNAPTTAGITTASANLTASMTLFNGLRNINQLQRAKMNAVASQYQLQDLVDDIRLNVANTYLNVLSNKESLKALQAQYAVTEQDLNRIREQVDAGVLPRGDLLEIQATAANLEQQVVNAENNVLLSRIVLAQLLQITDYENFDIADQEFEVPPSEILSNSPRVIFDKALTFRNDIAFSRSNVELAEQDLKIARGAYLPSLNAFFNYNTRYSSNTTLPDPANPGSFFSPTFVDQLWILDGISYGARLDVPIFNGWSTRNNVQRAKIDVMRAELQLEQDKLALENDINTAYLDVQSFAKAFEAAQKTLEARQLALEYARERYEVGLMNAFDYGQAQARVDDAQASVIQNKYNYIFRLKVLEFYFGLPITLD